MEETKAGELEEREGTVEIKHWVATYHGPDGYWTTTFGGDPAIHNPLTFLHSLREGSALIFAMEITEEQLERQYELLR